MKSKDFYVNGLRKRAVSQAFSGAVKTYEGQALVHRRAARSLAGKIEALPLAPNPTVMEIGCGTGLLTESLTALFPQARLLATDLSPAMAAHCARRLEGPNRTFLVMDGEAPALNCAADLIASSLAVQWFSDLGGGLRGLMECLRPGGAFAFVTLGEETFCQWRDALKHLGFPAGTPDYPSKNALAGMLEGLGGIEVEEERLDQVFPSSLDFLKSLKDLGSHLPRSGYRPLTPGALRKAMGYLDAKAGGNGVAMTYHLLRAVIRKG